MSSSYITLPFHIILYLMFFYFISSADLISNSTLFQIDLIWFYSILFYSILLNLIYYIVQYSISYQWMICVYLSVRPSVRLCVCLSVWISLCFLFSPVSLLFLFVSLSFLFLFSFHFNFSFFTLFSWTSSSHTHTHTDTDTDTQIHMNICSFLWLVHITSKGCKWRIVFEW